MSTRESEGIRDPVAVKYDLALGTFQYRIRYDVKELNDVLEDVRRISKKYKKHVRVYSTHDNKLVVDYPYLERKRWR